MFRKLNEKDREIWLTLQHEFYNSPAVLHPIPQEYYENTFNEIIKGSPYLDAYMIEKDQEVVGYGQISLTYSNEAGGMVVLLEELYIRPGYQGQGIGRKYFDFVHEAYKGKAKRFRLEVEPDNKAQRLYERIGYKALNYKQMYIEWE